MEVPFDSLSRGQSARLVYQVTGGNVPVGNPTEIRFKLPAAGEDAADAQASNSPAAGLLTAAGAAGLCDLGFGAGTNLLDAEALAVVRQLGANVEHVWAPFAVQMQNLGLVAEHLGPLDVAEAEQGLRSALRTNLAEAVTSDGVNLTAFKPVLDSVEAFTESLEMFGFGMPANLRLSPDVRGMLSTVWYLVHGAQLAWLAEHNIAVGADPEHVRVHPLDQAVSFLVRRLSLSTVEYLQLLRIVADAPEDLMEPFSEIFADSGAAAKVRFAEWVHERLVEPISFTLARSSMISFRLAHDIDPVFEGLYDDADFSNAQAWITDYLRAWVMSDAGLIYRTQTILEIQQDAEFWSSLAVQDGHTPWTEANLALWT